MASKRLVQGLAAGIVLCLSSGGAVQPGSGCIWLKEGWRFSLDMAGHPEDPAFDDSSWKTAFIPNNAMDISNELPRSVRPVWFRKRFRLQGVPEGARVVLRVDSVRSAEAWLNGKEAGKAAGGDSVLEQEVTQLVRQGENVLAIRTPVPGIGGGVRIFVQPEVHFAPDGLLLDTPGWQGGPAVLRVRARVGSHSRSSRKVQASVLVRDGGGKRLAAFESEDLEAAPESVRELEFRSGPISNPPLWSPASPSLCTVVADLRVDGQTVQRVESRFGFRWFRFDAEQGFFLNGSRLELRGTVYTKTDPGAFPDRAALWAHEIRLLKDMGLNFVRPAEGGIAEDFLDECDRAGLLATLQVHDEGDGVVQERNIRHDLSRNYNHPSMITWHFNGEGKNAEAARQQSRAARLMRSRDPVRPVTCVELGWRSPGTVGLVEADVAGQGNYTGWYEGTLEHIGPYMDSYRRLLVERYGKALPVIVSNYGAASDWTVHSDRPRRNDFSAEYFTEFHRRFVREISSRPWMSGGLIFTFRDIQSGQPIPRHTWKGVIDMKEKKKDAYFFYQSVWTDRPMAHIAQKDWTPRDVWPPGQARRIEVFSNCDRVELFHNDKPLGARSRAQGFVWDLVFAAGDNTLRAVGKKGAATAEDSAAIRVRGRPPAPEARLLPRPDGILLTWTAVPGVVDYCVFGGPAPGFAIGDATLIMTTPENSLRVQPGERDFYYRVAARHKGVLGEASLEVGRAPGALHWRFVNPGWLLSSPALADLDMDGRLEIVVGSYDGKVYALRGSGDPFWEFDTGDPVFSSASIASLRRGERPSIAIQSSSGLFVLTAEGKLRWKQEGIRQFDRNTKSPAVGDLDGDGDAETVAASDTGEVLAFSAEGKRLWRHGTAGAQNLGLNIATPLLVNLEGGKKGVVFAADDGNARMLDSEGKLLWKLAIGRSERLVGPVPGQLTLAAGRLEENGPVRILAGSERLQALDLAGKVVWERKDVSGIPSIAPVGKSATPCIALASGPRLRVLDRQGKDLWEFRLERFQDFFTHAPVAADLGSGSGPDLVVGSRATYVYAVSGQGKPLWTFRTDDELSSSPAVADLDGDGRAEVVIASRDGCLYVVGAGLVSPDALRALQFRAGPERTGESRHR